MACLALVYLRTRYAECRGGGTPRCNAHGRRRPYWENTCLGEPPGTRATHNRRLAMRPYRLHAAFHRSFALRGTCLTLLTGKRRRSICGDERRWPIAPAWRQSHAPWHRNLQVATEVVCQYL